MLTPTSNYLFYYKVDDDADARSVQSISLPDQYISSCVTAPTFYRKAMIVIPFRHILSLFFLFRFH